MKKVLLGGLLLLTLSTKTGAQGSNLLAANGTVNVVVTSVGNVPLDRFKATNEIAALMVAATPVNGTTLCAADKQLITELAALSKAQLKMSTLVNGRNGREELNLLASAMMEEQTIVQDKLKELLNAASINTSAPTTIEVPVFPAKLSIPVVEDFLLTDCGISNHERFLQLLQVARKNAQRPELRQLADAIIPSVQMRLHICRDLKAKYYPTVSVA